MLRKIRSLISNSDFIGIYDNALPKKECEILINQFEKSELCDGCVGRRGKTVVDPKIKECRQLYNPHFTDGSVISNIIFARLQSCIKKYSEKYSMNMMAEWNIHNDYSFQRYVKDGEGYKQWHCEHGPSPHSAKRILAWMFYLNNAKSGTDFMHYSSVRAKMGRCVIWPSGFTHMHKSTFNKGLKYIITGWASYEE